MSNVKALQERIEAMEAEVRSLRTGNGGKPTYRTLSDFGSRQEKLDFIEEHGLEPYLEIVNRSMK